MDRRTAAMLALCAGLAACEAKPTAPAAPAGPAGKVQAAIPPGYKPAVSPTLAAVRKRGFVACGINPGLPGFAFPDARGAWRGFDVDICRAVAAATLGDATKVRFTTLSAEARFTALQKGEIDVLSRNTSQTFARSAGLGVTFPVIAYYDGQGFLAPRSLGLNSAEELEGARVCVQAGTVTADNLGDWFQVRGMKVRPVLARSEAEARRMYETEACDVFTADVSALAASRSLLSNPNAHVILADVISKEPLGPVVRQADPVWAEIVRWSVDAMIQAEELHISSRNVAGVRDTTNDPEMRRLLGVEGNLGALLGLSPDWAFQVIRQVGAYDEVFRRDLGPASALRLDRGLNALWNAPKPGLLYAPPMR